MKLKLTTLILTALILAILTMACAKPPTEEMDSATEAVTRAENDIDAITYAGNSITRAREALARMYSEAAAKRYDAAKSYAVEAIAAAERAISEGRTGAARARDEASALVSELKPLVEETGQGIDAAYAAGLPLDYDSLIHDFNAARNNTELAQEALSGSRYQDAIKLGHSARSDLYGINQQLSSIATASVGKK